jgi:UDP-4-amino-4,6-dideoxy-N-acetyl-beta-L-altrosamine transaminase
MIPYGRQFIEDDDIKEIVKTLKGDFITTGPKIKEFEEEFAKYLGVKYAVAVSSGTAALHLACLSAGLKQGDELITSPMTFTADANCALYCKALPVFADINEKGLINPEKIREKITNKTKVIIPIDYSGLSCNIEEIKRIAQENNLIVIRDCCHALGGEYKGEKIGNCRYADMCIFSFHPVKHITTGEGGMITTNSKELYEKLIILRNHGITKDREKLQKKEHLDKGWYFEQQELGFNYRITDIQCALGLSQLKKLDKFVEKRRKIAEKYDFEFRELIDKRKIEILKQDIEMKNPYHLYIIKLKDSEIRKKLYDFLKEKGILCQVHHIPIYLHPYYQKLGHVEGECIEAEKFYNRILSLPIYISLKNEEQDFVIKNIKDFFNNNFKYSKKEEGLGKIGIIIQARMASTRLPEKIMKDLSGKPVLWHVVERCKRADVDEVIVATSINPENNIIGEFCKKNNYAFFRGSEEDVLSRYYEAAKKFNLDIIIRITADCPLISPEIINKLIEKFIQEDKDYIGNLALRSFPRGLDVEIFSFGVLEKTHNLGHEKQHRENVTNFIYNNPDLFKLGNLIAENDLKEFRGENIRLTIDTVEDLKLLRILYNKFYKDEEGIIDIKEVLKFLEKNPEIAKINLKAEKQHLKQNIESCPGQKFVK